MLRCLRLHFSCVIRNLSFLSWYLRSLGFLWTVGEFSVLCRVFYSFVVSESLFDLLADVFHLSLHLFCPYSFFFRWELWALLPFSVNLFFSLSCCRSHVLLLFFSYRLLFFCCRDVLSWSFCFFAFGATAACLFCEPVLKFSTYSCKFVGSFREHVRFACFGCLRMHRASSTLTKTVLPFRVLVLNFVFSATQFWIINHCFIRAPRLLDSHNACFPT